MPLSVKKLQQPLPEWVALPLQSEPSVLDELLSGPFLRKLEILARTGTEHYRANTPWPHIYFDNFLPLLVAEAALQDFPEPKEITWYAHTDVHQRKKLAYESAEKLPATLRDILYFLNSRPMLSFLEALTGIDGLLGDPTFAGGGLHQTKRGGLVEVHADFTYHDVLRLDRRINVLIYLNKEWPDDYAGHFELWDHTMAQAEKKILPVFNRCVIFNTTSQSFHGHPLPLACPSERSRKSLATFYYSNGRPEEDPGVTERHAVQFQQRPGFNRVKLTLAMKRALRSITPPLLATLLRRRGKRSSCNDLTR